MSGSQATAEQDDWAPAGAAPAVVSAPAEVDDWHGVEDWAPAQGTPATALPDGYKMGANNVPQYVGADRGLWMGGSALLKGAAALAGTPGDLEWMGRKALGWMGAPVSDQTLLPNSADTVGLTNRLGLTDRLELQPQNLAERLGSAAMSAVPAAGAGVAQGLRVVPSLVAGVAGGLAPAAVDEVAPDAPTWMKVGAGLGASLVGGRIAGGLAGVGAARDSAGNLLSAEQKLAAAKAAEGQLADQQFSASNQAPLDKLATKTASETLRDQAIAQADAGEASAHATAQGQIAQIRGPETTAEAAGTAHQQQMNFWLGGVRQQEEAAMAPANAAIDPSAPHSPTNLVEAMRQQARTGMDGDWAAGLNQMDPSPARNLLTTFQRNPEMAENMQWSHAEDLRKTFGNMLARDPDNADLKQLYAANMNDMRSTAHGLPSVQVGSTGSTVSPGELFENGMRQVKDLHDFRSDVAAPIMAARPDRVANRVLSMSAPDITELRQRLGPDSTTPLLRAALTPQQGANVTPWTKLRPEVQSALVPETAARQTLNNLHSGMDDATELAEEARAGAKSDHTDRMTQDQVARATQAEQDAIAARQAGKATDEAQAGVAAFKPTAGQRATDLANLGFHTLAGGHVGHDLGTVFGEQLIPGINTLQAGAMGEAAGMLGPIMLRHFGAAVTNPRDLRYSGVGALGASPGVADSIVRRKQD